VSLIVGTSGWHYRDWRGPVYPPKLPTRQWLAYLAAELPTIELNSTFYRLPERSAFESWASQVPDGFEFAVKASRYLTHVRRLREPEEPVQRLLERAEGLGRRRGPFLVQLPPDLRVDAAALDRTLAAFGRSRRVAVEVRHPSWRTDEVRRVLERRKAACCWADRRGRLPPRWRTAEWGYVRMHEGRASPAPSYGRAALASLVDEVGRAFGADDSVYVYFNNDQGGAAVRNARLLGRLAGRTGVTPNSVS
jgi:uncharacterized protein YecE (DUF72 family)